MERQSGTHRIPWLCNTFDIIIAISALEMALKKSGPQVELGKGVATAQEILLEAY